MTSTLDQKGLEAARKARDEAWPLDSLEAIIRAYLSTVIPAEIAGVVEKLNRGELSYISDSGPVYRGPTLLMSEAATLIERLAASQAETRRLALEEAAKLIDDNMLCDGADGREVLHPRFNPGNHVGEAYAAAIRALIDQPGTEGGMDV